MKLRVVVQFNHDLFHMHVMDRVGNREAREVVSSHTWHRFTRYPRTVRDISILIALATVAGLDIREYLTP